MSLSCSLVCVYSGTGGLLLRTVHTLQSLTPPSPSINLIVPKILQKLLRVHLVTEEPSALSTDTHLSCWGYETEQSEGASDGGRVVGRTSLHVVVYYMYLCVVIVID